MNLRVSRSGPGAPQSPAPSLRISTITQARWDSDPFSARGTAALLSIAARTLSAAIAILLVAVFVIVHLAGGGMSGHTP
ncbi:hypothetical protein J7E87_14760 [Streptomyces sp. ISL-1]|uniref:hypothetical protein n=1 Tax=Streptomyces sp. ISL-1 TaxID=2817657 RepID=UPI001BED0373|nr:hypothetical protein [Streptomyces sp. ISL-1]MBT2390650.1 hypothetical protein [Streptomyces sp. ISL-1]